MYLPVDGTVTEVNEALNDNTELVNESAQGEGWIAKIDISNPAQLEELLDQVC